MADRGRPLNPVRTCVGCRRRAAKSELLRVVALDHRVVADPEQTRTGRGAYLHPRRECVDAALRRRAFGRALRHSGLDPLGLISEIGLE